MFCSAIAQDLDSPVIKPAGDDQLMRCAHTPGQVAKRGKQPLKVLARVKPPGHIQDECPADTEAKMNRPGPRRVALLRAEAALHRRTNIHDLLTVEVQLVDGVVTTRLRDSKEKICRLQLLDLALKKLRLTLRTQIFRVRQRNKVVMNHCRRDLG